MIYVYYDEFVQTVYLSPRIMDGHGVLIGRLSQPPKQPAFVVQALLDHAGFKDVTGLKIVNSVQ